MWRSVVIKHENTPEVRGDVVDRYTDHLFDFVDGNGGVFGTVWMDRHAFGTGVFSGNVAGTVSVLSDRMMIGGPLKIAYFVVCFCICFIWLVDHILFFHINK